jgi:hypothetical protein
MEQISNILLYSGFALLLLLSEWLYLRWAFKKKGILKILGLFFDFPGKKKLYSFFENFKKENRPHDPD